MCGIVCAVVDVSTSYDEEVNAHDEVTDGQVGQEVGLYLRGIQEIK